jgi:DNA-binding CsgD family transcriptional regulator
MSAETDTDGVVGDLYEATTRPEHWQTALAGLARHTGANEFHLLRWNRASQQPSFNVHSDGIEAAIEQYATHYANIDPRRMLVAAGPAGRVSACQHRFDERYVERNEFYQDFLAAWGMRRSLSSLLFEEGDEQLMLGLVRAKDRGPFDDTEVARLVRLMPHLQRACRMWMQVQRVQEQAAFGAQVAESTGLAWLGLDRAGHLLQASPLAERLLREDNGLALRGGRLVATDADDAVRLKAAVARAAAGLPGTELMLGSRRSGIDASAVSVIGASTSRPDPIAVLVIVRRGDGSRAPSPARLAQAFGLTAAESKVALALLDGKTPAEYAAAATLSVATVRTHLSAIFAKTCTRRQAEAVQVLRGLRS